MPPKWTFGICCLGTLLGLAALFHHADVATAAQITTLANSLISGAFGAAAGAAGHAIYTSRKTTFPGDSSGKIEEESSPIQE